MKINCLNCGCIEATAEDGMICAYRNIEDLEDFLDIETMFCKEYKYNECLDCELENCDGCVEDKTYCTVCNKEMSEGYVINDGLENYCSKKCLDTEITDDEYNQLYEEGYAFWTTFED